MSDTNKSNQTWEIKINPLGLFITSLGVGVVLDSVAKIVTAFKSK